MPIVKQSFLLNLLGENTYYDFKRYSLLIVSIGTIAIIIAFTLSYFFHWGPISGFLNLVSGMSLLFIVYIVELILLLDVVVEVEVPECYYLTQKQIVPKPFSYKLTVVWGVILIVMGISAIYLTNEYRNNYAFECDTFIVDKETGIFHISWLADDCNLSDNSVKMTGLEIIENGYTLCEDCRIAEEDASDY